jgi:hypothetical protein
MSRIASIALATSLVLASGNASGSPEPATKAARKVMEIIGAIEQKLTETKYQHKTFVHPKKGLFFWDCSGMSAWILERAAPRARKKLPGKHPMARKFHNVIDKSPETHFKAGWRKLSGPEQILPGDVFAWVRPEWWTKSKNSGHVGFVVGPPYPSPTYEGAWLMRIADSSRYRHEDDSRPAGGQGGYGTGVIAFLFDHEGGGAAYGWYGSLQDIETYVSTSVVFGRVNK